MASSFYSLYGNNSDTILRLLDRLQEVNTAYDVWLATGNTGTKEQFLASLIGAKGDKGDKGLKGDTGIGLPTGGLTGQVLAKLSNNDFDFGWVNLSTPIEPPVNLTPPVITGTTQDGGVMFASNGTWAQSPTSFTYQWFRNGATIPGAVSAVYTSSGDVGSYISVGVTAKKSGANDIIAFSSTVLITAAAVLTLRQQIAGLETFVTPNGVQSGTAFLTPSANANRLPAGMIVSGVQVINNSYSGDLTTDRWDFTGYIVDIRTPMGRIANCKFGDPSAGLYQLLKTSGAGKIDVVEYCDFVGRKGTGILDSALVGDIREIRFCRFTDIPSDCIKATGTTATGGQIIHRNYFGPPWNLPNVDAVNWNATTNYSSGTLVTDIARNPRPAISKVSGNINNPIPTGTVSDAFWAIQDPHVDQITVVDAVNKVTISENMFDFRRGSRKAMGENNFIRLCRNNGSASLYNEVLVRDNLMTVTNGSSMMGYPIDLSDNGLGNFTGPFSFTGNWIPKGISNKYFAPGTGRVDGHVSTWINNKDTDTDAIITAPTLPLVPFVQTRPVITGTTEVGQTLTCASVGTFANFNIGTDTTTIAWRRTLGGVTTTVGTASTYTLVAGDTGATFAVTVTATNPGGSTTTTSLSTAVITTSTAPPITYSITNLAGSTTLNTIPNIRVSLDGGVNWYLIGTGPAAPLTIARHSDGDKLVVSGWANNAARDLALFHYENFPAMNATAPNAQDALIVRRVGSPAPVNTEMASGGMTVSPTFFNTPVGVS